MKSMNRRRRESQGGVRDLVAKRPEAYTTDLARKAVGDLDASNSAVDAGFATASKGRDLMRWAVKERRRLRNAIIASVRRIVRTAVLVCLDLGRTDDFSMPEIGSDRQVMADAKAIADRALPFLDRFVVHKLPASVITDLPAQIAALDAAIASSREGRAIRVAAQNAIAKGLDTGSKAMDVLERTYMNAYGDDVEAVTVWHNRRRVGPAHPAAAAAAPETTTPAQTAPNLGKTA